MSSFYVWNFKKLSDIVFEICPGQEQQQLFTSGNNSKNKERRVKVLEHCTSC